MICKAAPRGSRVRGLVEYLFGPGRSDQHTDQHVVAAYDDVLVGDTGQTEVGRAMLAAELDFPRRAFAPEVTEDHVYHVAISSKGGVDRDLTDAEWREVAELTADRLGFTPSGDDVPGDGVAVRWIAVRHGHSSAGNDHIHLVANLVREDGRKHHFTRPDWTVLREVAAEVEVRFGLTVTGASKTGTPAMSRLEVETQRASRLESPRERLRRGVRSSATAARTESEFVGLLRAEGLMVRPRWAAGGRDTVIGYSVAKATRPGSGEQLVWFGGGKLDRDLTLPGLRQGWEPDPGAVAAWREVDPASRTTATRPASAARAAAPSPEVLTDAARRVHQVTEALAAVPLHDTAAWSALARDTAGVLSALSQRVGGAQGIGLVKAAHSMSRAVVREPRTHVPASPHAVSMSQVARASLTVLAAAQGGSTGTVILLTQIVALSRAIAEAQRAAGRLAQAQAGLDAVQHARASLAALGGPRALPETAAAAGVVRADGRVKTAAELAREATGARGPRRLTTQPLPPPRRTGPAPVHRDRDDDLGR